MLRSFQINCTLSLTVFLFFSFEIFAQKVEHGYCNWQPNDPRFFTYSKEFTSPGINGIVQDHEGFMWFGSEEGLYRFDGVNFKKFVHDDKDSLSIPVNKCKVHLVDSRGFIWITTTEGVSYYNPVKDNFRNFKRNDTLFPVGSINGIREGREHDVWICCDGKYSLARFNYVSGKFKVFKLPDSVNGTYSKCILLHPNGKVYLGTGNYVLILNSVTEKYETCISKQISDSEKTEKKRYWGSITNIYRDTQGRIYVGFFENEGIKH